MSDEKPKSSNKFKYPKEMEKFVKFGQPVDCTFLVGPDVKCADAIEGHKFIFATASPVFEGMLFGEFKEKTSPFEIHIPDDNPDAFYNLRYLLYHVDALRAYSVIQLMDLYRVCDKYLMENQTARISDELKLRSKDIPSKEINIVLSFAMDYQLIDLLSHIWRRINELSWPSDNIDVLKPNQFLTYTSRWKEGYTVHLDELIAHMEPYIVANDLMPNNFLDWIPENEDEKAKHKFIEAILLDNLNLEFSSNLNTEFKEYRRKLIYKYGY